MAIMVGTGRGAHGGRADEERGGARTPRRVDTLVVDKTGTLTEGKPRVTAVDPCRWADAATRSCAGRRRSSAAASIRSRRPIVAAADDAQARDPCRLATSRRRPGKGIAGTVEGTTRRRRQPRVDGLARRGRRRRGRSDAEQRRRDGATALVVAVDGRVAGLIAVADPLQPVGTRSAIAALHGEGLHVVMLTGDNRTRPSASRAKLGIDDVRAEVLPDEKARRRRANCRPQGRVVAMAGDGINDAPALAQAAVGIAMGTGTDVAMESAGVTLVKGDLRGIVRARRLSRATLRNIRQNLFLAFVYNAVGVPLAAGVLYPFSGLLISPIWASAAMTLSSVSVIANALRLRHVTL